jgi:hypothetical protein
MAYNLAYDGLLAAESVRAKFWLLGNPTNPKPTKPSNEFYQETLQFELKVLEPPFNFSPPFQDK